MYWQLCKHPECDRCIDTTNPWYPWCSREHFYQDIAESRMFTDSDDSASLIFADEL